MKEHKTACILCSENCGLRVEVGSDGHLGKIKGDPDHPSSEGYLCQKAARLDHYQNHNDRLDAPLRRRADGSFERVSWDEALSEIAAQLVSLREAHTGRALAYYGGGGQGNHLGGVYGSGLRAAMETDFIYTALAQEKTGDFWVNGKLFGRQTCHVTDDIENADCVLFIGTNPWQAHGIPQARRVLKALSKDPERTMIVVDPRRTETAALADQHIAPRPSTDAFLLTAMLATLVQEDLVDHAFLRAHCTGYARLEAVLRAANVEANAEKCGVSVEEIQRASRALANAKCASVRADLGLQQSLRSTLNSYLEKLLFLLTGNFARPGGNNLHSFLLPLIGHSDADDERTWRTTVTDMPAIGKLYPPNLLPKEIDSDHPGRVRGLIVDSANPVMSGADTTAYRDAFSKLELLVVIDVALTETAQLAHYVLPASSQLEKWEATFFTLSFPKNTFHLRAPILDPLPGTLPEPEMYRRLVVAMGALPERLTLLSWIAKLDRRWPKLRLYPAALAATFRIAPRLKKQAALVLYETLGNALPDGAKSPAVLWASAHAYAKRQAEAVRRAGHRGRGAALGEALFDAILHSRSGMVLSEHRYEDVWGMVRNPDRKITLAIDPLLDEIAGLEDAEAPTLPAERPLVLAAGERRAYNANTIYRNPSWRRNDLEGSLRVHPEDAERYGLEHGKRARCASRRGSVEVQVEVTDRVRAGVVSLPHGYGLDYPGADGERRRTGPVLNLLTSSEDCDPIAKTPYHKFVPVSVTPI